MVAGQGARGPEEQDRAPLGATGNPALRPARPETELGLHLRGDLPSRGPGRGPSPAEMRHARDEPTPGGGRAGAPGAHGVILMDRAGGHGAKELLGPDTLTLGLLPARAPELNPVETIWPFLRDTCVEGRAILAHLTVAAERACGLTQAAPNSA